MALIETKYSVGDVVYHAGTTTQTKQHPCPDCNDTKAWAAVSPAGNEYSFACPRCASNYQHRTELSLKYVEHVPFVGKLTIGSVQFNSATGSYDSGARYMCRETGIGSGQFYSEADLFATHEEAMTAATAKAALSNETVPHIVTQFNRTLEVSDYQLENVALKVAQEATSLAGQLLWNFSDLVETIKEADDKDAIVEAVEEYQEYHWERDLSKSAEVIATAEAARQAKVAAQTAMEAF